MRRIAYRFSREAFWSGMSRDCSDSLSLVQLVTRIGLSLCVSYQWGSKETEVNSTAFLLMRHSWSPRRDRSWQFRLVIQGQKSVQDTTGA